MPSGRFAGLASMLLCSRVKIVELQGRDFRSRVMEGWWGRREFISWRVEWIWWY
jgi:hypothetical protein